MKDAFLRTAVNTDDGWRIQLLPKRDLFDAGSDMLLELSNPAFYSKVVNSLAAWVDKAHPPILVEHERDGEIHGTVTEIIDGGDGIYAMMVPDAETEEKINRRKYRHVSVSIAWNFKADDYSPRADNTWPAALIEVSLVSVPRHFLTQPSIQELNPEKLNEVYLSEPAPKATVLVSQLFEESDMTEEQIKALFAEMLAPIMERLETIERDTAEARDDDRDEMEEEKEESETTASEDMPAEEETVAAEPAKEEETLELSSDERYTEMEQKLLQKEMELAEARKQIQLKEAEAQVTSDLAGRAHLSSLSEKLVGVYLVDKDLYRDMLAVADNAPAQATSNLSERFSGGGTPTLPGSGPSKWEKASSLAREKGISFEEAFSQVR